MILTAAYTTLSRVSLNWFSFASMILFGFVTKSKAPSSKDLIASSAPSMVRVLTTTTGVFMLSFCRCESTSRPFILGIFISRITASYFCVRSFSSASSPSLHVSVACNLLSELIISHSTLLSSAESSTIKMLDFILLLHFSSSYASFFFKHKSDYFLPFCHAVENKL